MPEVNNPLQPFINLTQANMALLARYAISPDGMTQAMAQLQAAMSPRSNAASVLPTAFPGLPELVQGMMQNYAQFMTELAQAGMSALAQGQAMMVQQAQDTAGASSQARNSRRNK